MANQFFVAPSPHVHSAESTTKIMRDVVIALLPALVVSALLFGWSVLGVTALSVVCCVVFEYLIQRFMLRGAPTVGNLSAVVTGVLLAFNLPASIPWWIVVIGAFVAIAIGKMTFGGLGKNPFNPALVGRVFLLIAYPAQMTSFPQPAGAVADAGRTDPWTDQVDASRGEYVGDGVPRTFNGEPFEPLSGYPTPGAAPAPADPAAPDFLSTPSDFTTGNAR